MNYCRKGEKPTSKRDWILSCIFQTGTRSMMIDTCGIIYGLAPVLLGSSGDRYSPLIYKSPWRLQKSIGSGRFWNVGAIKNHRYWHFRNLLGLVHHDNDPSRTWRDGCVILKPSSNETQKTAPREIIPHHGHVNGPHTEERPRSPPRFTRSRPLSRTSNLREALG